MVLEQEPNKHTVASFRFLNILLLVVWRLLKSTIGVGTRCWQNERAPGPTCPIVNPNPAPTIHSIYTATLPSQNNNMCSYMNFKHPPLFPTVTKTNLQKSLDMLWKCKNQKKSSIFYEKAVLFCFKLFFYFEKRGLSSYCSWILAFPGIWIE